MRINPNALFAAIVASQGAIATLTTGSFTGRNTTGRDLYISRWRVRGFYDGAQTDQDGTPLTNTASSTAVNTSGSPATLVTVNVKIGAESWFTQEVSLATIFDDNTGWFEFKHILPLVSPDQEINVSYTNGTGKTIKLRAVFEGFAVPKGAPAVLP